MARRQIRIGKIDLDTVGAAWLLGVNREDEVIVLRGEASKEDLANPAILCIEVGGSGLVSEGNFDHHQEGGPEDSATAQAYKFADCDWNSPRVKKYLVDYIDILDTKGPRALGPKVEGRCPTLSDVFAGMLLTTRDPVEQLHLGVEILREVYQKKIDPFGRMPIEDNPDWQAYTEAKAENNRQVAKVLEQAQWTYSVEYGTAIGYLESPFFGSVGALYGAGAEVAVVLNPNMNGVRKFTVAGNEIRMDSIISLLNEREPGWGGPPTGTILGSPREGSNLSLEEVVKIVEDNLKPRSVGK